MPDAIESRDRSRLVGCRKLSVVNSPEDVVGELVARGLPLSVIEQHIDMFPFDEDRRSALWLLAWARTSNPPRPRYGA